ncbi:hypothetical protein [Cohnella soli]|uniref:ABC transporter permease n=1 Tax=Cohnella soli TaxID=425005 RepID=A0ABW0HYP7_9BACL
MNKLKMLLKASRLQLRLYLCGVAGLVAISLLVDIILLLSLPEGENSHVSASNIMTVFLVLASTVLPFASFKRIINLGATRKEYYTGLLISYVFWAIIFAVFNIAWLKLEIGLSDSLHSRYMNILEIFHWDQFGVAGMFVYQLGIYLLLMSVFNLLFSGIRHVTGWILWVVFIAAIPIMTSIPTLRSSLGDGFKVLLYNDSLLQGFGITFLSSCVLFTCGWLFTRTRAF